MFFKHCLKYIHYLCLLCFNFLYSFINYHKALNHKECISPGIEYQYYSSTIPPLSVHVLMLKPNSYSVDLITAQGQREEVSSIAQRSGAFIAINGANYRRGGKYNGNRVNLCYKKDTLYADPCYWRGSLAWISQEKKWVIDDMYGSFDLQIGNKRIPIEGVNQPRSPGKNMLYTNNDLRCLYHNPGFNIVISQGEIISIDQNQVFNLADSAIILQVENSDGIAQGMKAHYTYQLTTKDTLIKPDFALGGAGILIRNGINSTDSLYEEFSNSVPLIHTADEAAADFYRTDQQEYLITLPHPRTAVGIDKHGNLYIVVVDGRQKNSIGFTLYELAKFMEFLGCTHAINLGGGGCTTLFCNGKIINSPSQGAERPVSEALCFFTS
jgi:exopolysaccharide biosynthesis protein